MQEDDRRPRTMRSGALPFPSTRDRQGDISFFHNLSKCRRENEMKLKTLLSQSLSPLYCAGRITDRNNRLT